MPGSDYRSESCGIIYTFMLNTSFAIGLLDKLNGTSVMSRLLVLFKSMISSRLSIITKILTEMVQFRLEFERYNLGKFRTLK